MISLPVCESIPISYSPLPLQSILISKSINDNSQNSKYSNNNKTSSNYDFNNIKRGNEEPPKWKDNGGSVLRKRLNGKNKQLLEILFPSPLSDKLRLIPSPPKSESISIQS